MGLLQAADCARFPPASVATIAKHKQGKAGPSSTYRARCNGASITHLAVTLRRRPTGQEGSGGVNTISIMTALSRRIDGNSSATGPLPNRSVLVVQLLGHELESRLAQHTGRFNRTR